MNSQNFTVGALYHQAELVRWNGRVVPVIQTWVYEGLSGEPGDVAATGPTRPFQIPLGALVPRDADNLLPACKNIRINKNIIVL